MVTLSLQSGPLILLQPEDVVSRVQPEVERVVRAGDVVPITCILRFHVYSNYMVLFNCLTMYPFSSLSRSEVRMLTAQVRSCWRIDAQGAGFT